MFSNFGYADGCRVSAAVKYRRGWSSVNGRARIIDDRRVTMTKEQTIIFNPFAICCFVLTGNKTRY